MNKKINFNSNLFVKRSKAHSALLMSLDSDFYLLIHGPLKDIIPLVQEGCSEEELLNELSLWTTIEEAKSVLKHFFEAAVSCGIIDYEVTINPEEKRIEFGHLGSMHLKSFAINEEFLSVHAAESIEKFDPN